jgi:serine/threonine protein kinase
MELVDGTPLKGLPPLKKAIEYAGQILDALDADHRKGINHRDLKQGIKLLDFGLAKQTSGLGPDDLTGAPGDRGRADDRNPSIYVAGAVAGRAGRR